MTVFISSTTETREKRGRGVEAEASSTGDGVGIGTLKMRIEDQRVVYATRRGMKTSMVDITRSWPTKNGTPCGIRVGRTEPVGGRRTPRAEMMKVEGKRRSGGKLDFILPFREKRGSSVSLPRETVVIFVQRYLRSLKRHESVSNSSGTASTLDRSGTSTRPRSCW